jgi:hypothetical protein
MLADNVLSSLNQVMCGGGVLAGQAVMVCLNTPLQGIVGYRFYRGGRREREGGREGGGAFCNSFAVVVLI